jgi:signal transduction histidine kinase
LLGRADFRRARFAGSRRLPESTVCCKKLQELIGLVSHELRSNTARLELDLDESLPPVLVVTVQIQQVILNLVRNAVEAMAAEPPDDRVLSIRAQRTPAGVQFSVTDTGNGFDPSVATKLFEPFQTTKSTGMGIGLSICKTLLRAHHGSIGTYPNAHGGTVFHFDLPVVNEQAIR